MKKIEKMARQDATEFLAAEMFYGEGAGTRRKLVKAMVDQKMIDYADTNYYELFDKAYHSLDMNKAAQAAIRERKSLDRMAKAGKNFRAIKSGNYNNLSTGVFIVVGAAIVAHKTGYDKVIEAKAKAAYKRAKTEIKFARLKAQGKNVERIN